MIAHAPRPDLSRRLTTNHVRLNPQNSAGYDQRYSALSSTGADKSIHRAMRELNRIDTAFAQVGPSPGNGWRGWPEALSPTSAQARGGRPAPNVRRQVLLPLVDCVDANGIRTA